jgi:hypothetical protein
LIGEHYFKPLFDKILEHQDFKEEYSAVFKRYQTQKRVLFFLPQMIFYGGSALMSQALGNANKRTSLKNKANNYRRKMINDIMDQEIIEEGEDDLEDMKMSLFATLKHKVVEQQKHQHDDRYVLADKLIKGMQGHNLNALILSRCPMLFDRRLPLFNQYR